MQIIRELLVIFVEKPTTAEMSSWVKLVYWQSSDQVKWQSTMAGSRTRAFSREQDKMALVGWDPYPILDCCKLMTTMHAIINYFILHFQPQKVFTWYKQKLSKRDSSQTFVMELEELRLDVSQRNSTCQTHFNLRQTISQFQQEVIDAH